MKNFTDILNKIFSDEEYIKNLFEIEDNETNNIENVEQKLSKILCYYITTRDTAIRDYKFIDIEYDRVAKSTDKMLLENADEFFSTSFNGYKKSIVEGQGLSHTENEEHKKSRRDALRLLETILGSSEYGQVDGNAKGKTEEDKKTNQTEYTFLCNPGAKSIYYAHKASPERLYKGPLKDYGKEPIIVGESKENYMFRILEKKIKHLYNDDIKSKEYSEAIEAAKLLASTYGKEDPAIALVKKDGIKFWWTATIKENVEPFNSKDRKGITKVEEGFTKKVNDDIEAGITNMVIKTGDANNNVSAENVKVISLIDMFKIVQLQAREQGAKTGDLVDYNTGKKIGEPTLEQLSEMIKSAISRKDKKIFKEIYQKRKERVPETVRKVFNQMDQKELLDSDREIREDTEQYNSVLHGTNHTRRVNFYAIHIMNELGVKGRDREIILAAVKNHDIGRINDFEDKGHGIKSISKLEDYETRLNNYSEEEQKIIKFAITQHSLSKKENEEAIRNLPEGVDLQKYGLVLSILKDADKMDRVRLEDKSAFKNFHSATGLEIDRFIIFDQQTEKAEDLGNLAWDGLDTITGLLDCEQAIEYSKNNEKRRFLEGIVNFENIKGSFKGIKDTIFKVRDQIGQVLERKKQVDNNKHELELVLKNKQNIDNQINKENDNIQLSSEYDMKEVFIGNTGKMYYINDRANGGEYYFKPAISKDGDDRPYRAYIQESAYYIQQIINPESAVKCNTIELNGMFGAIQEKVPIDITATKNFKEYFNKGNGELQSEMISQILDEYLVDYCLCNYDSHYRNFIIDKNGKLRGIDKEQSFRYIKEDKDMMFSTNYNERYGENPSIYNILFEQMKQGKISYKHLATLRYRASRLAQFPDEKYSQIFEKYAYGKAKTPAEGKILLDNILKRKSNILQDIEQLYDEISNECYKNKEAKKSESLLKSAIDATEESIRTGKINEQTHNIRTKQQEKTKSIPEIKKDNMNKDTTR